MSGPFNDKNNISNMKKNLTLDFSQPLKNLSIPSSNGGLLSPGDLNLPKIDTPELENLILENGMPSTPSPSLLFPRSVTVEQESFAGGFEEALSRLHNSSYQGSDSNASTVCNDQNFLPVVKEEPQTVPNMNTSPPLSPVDMEYQERIKLERKRQRNRLAASKCRSRKLERISKLEEKVKLLKGENVELGSMINQLREHVGLLKLEVLDHVNSGCPIIVNQY